MCCHPLQLAHSLSISKTDTPPQFTWRAGLGIYFLLNGVIHHVSFAANEHGVLPESPAG